MLHFLITAGPTIEDIDPVRYISNRATGKLGVALTHAALKARHHVTLIHGPLTDSVLQTIPKNRALKTLPVRSAAEMHRAVMREVQSADIVIMNAAVADFTPVKTSATKLKKAQTGLTLHLKPTVDILKELGHFRARRMNLVLVGFALESGSGNSAKQREDSRMDEAQRKLKEKNLDVIVLDSPKTMAAAHGEFTVISRDESVRRVKASKQAFAKMLVNTLAGSIALAKLTD